MYHFTDCGLDNVYLENGYQIEVEDGEEFVSFYNIDGIHRAIATAICEKSQWLTKEQFKFLRKELNLSQSALGTMLFCDRQTIARWEKGETPISQAQDIILRAIYIESIDKESHVSLMAAALADAEAEKIQQNVVLKEDNGQWREVEMQVA